MTHLPTDALADLLVGEGSEADEAHVATCAQCAGALGDLEDVQERVSGSLALLPVQAAPSELAARLDAAFTDEPALVSAPTAEDPALTTGDPAPTTGAPSLTTGDPALTTGDPAPVAAGPGGGATVVPLGQARRRTSARVLSPRVLSPRVLGVAAAVVALAVAVPLALSQLGGTDEQTSTAAAPGSVGLAASVPTSSTGNDYAADRVLLTAALPALLGAGPPSGSTAEAAPRAEAPLPAQEGQAQEGPAQEGQAQEGQAQEGQAQEGQADQGPAQPEGDAAAALDRLRDPAALADCLSAFATTPGAPVEPLALDYASYEGRPALVVVLPGSEQSVDVFVVGAGCTAADEQTLLFTRLPR